MQQDDKRARALARARLAAPATADGLVSLTDELQHHIFSFLSAAELARAACVCKALSNLAIAAADLALRFKDLASPAHTSIRALDVEEACVPFSGGFWLDNQGGITEEIEEVQGESVVHLRSTYHGHWRTAVTAERLSRTTCLKMRLTHLGLLKPALGFINAGV